MIKIAYVFAHPDDESYLTSALSMRLRKEGGTISLLTATLGEAGQKGLPPNLAHLTKEELGQRRWVELTNACGVLGITHVEHLDWLDGKLADADPLLLQKQVESFLNCTQARIAVTFRQDNPHPDHAAISAATRTVVRNGNCPALERLYVTARIGSKERVNSATCVIDTDPYWSIKREALLTHMSQRLTIQKVFGDLKQPPEDFRYEVFDLDWSRTNEHLIQASSLWEGMI